jgi:hypothetical protein
MGDRKPSQFLRHLRSLAPDVSDDLIRSIWSNRLPRNIRAILACQSEGDLDAAGRCADRIIEAAPQPALASVGPPTEKSALLQGKEVLSRQVAAIRAEQDRLRARNPHPSPRDPCPGPRTRRSGSRSPTRSDSAPSTCWYHRRFGARAQKCTPPCNYRQQGNWRSRHHRPHMSALQQQATSSSRIDSANGSSWLTQDQISASIPADSSREARNAPVTISARLTTLPSTPTDGCPSA